MSPDPVTVRISRNKLDEGLEADATFWQAQAP